MSYRATRDLPDGHKRMNPGHFEYDFVRFSNVRE